MPTDADAVVGVDLGGTKISCGLVDAAGAVRFRHEVPTPATSGRDAVLDAAAVVVGRTLGDARGDGIAASAIGLGSAGVIDAAAGRVVSATDTVAEWVGTDLVAEFERRLDLPTTALNDVHAHALGEAWLGAGRGHDSMLLVAVGTGIGGAFLVGGDVVAGDHWLAGHLGHIPCEEAIGVRCSCGRDGHLEGVASGPGIHRSYLRAGGDPGLRDAGALFASLESGSVPPEADLAIDLAAVALGRSIGGWINTLDPHVVVVSGGVAQAGGRWWQGVLASAAQETLLPLDRTAVVRSELPDAAILGAGRRALRR